MIPRDTYDGAFYRAVLALHMDQFQLAQQCIDKARDILDTELTAMAGESYQRAYGVSLQSVLYNFPFPTLFITISNVIPLYYRDRLNYIGRHGEVFCSTATE